MEDHIMENDGEPCPLIGFRAVCNKAQGQLDPASPHARNAALMPFLFYIHPSNSGHLHVLTSDFHYNTWHGSFTCEYLNNLKESIGIKDGFTTYLQGLHDGFSSSKVKVELGGPASAVGGEGASCARLKTWINVHGAAREVALDLELSQGRCANDTMGTLAWELFDSLMHAKGQISHLERALKEEKEKCAKVLDAVVQGKPTSVHFISSKTTNWRPDVSPPLATLIQPSRSLINCSEGRVNSTRSSALKLAAANRYGRTTKVEGRYQEKSYTSVHSVSDKKEEGIIGESHMADRKDDALLTPGPLESAACSPLGSEMLNFVGDKRKVENSEEVNSGVMTWARRHYMEWRKEQGLPEKQIEDMPLNEFADSLVKFFLMVKKRNGSLFPSESLKSMFRAFVRILRSHYRSLYLQGKYDGPTVDASKDIIFEKARLACLEAMKYSIIHGGSAKKRRVNDRGPASEEDILHHPANQTTHAHGLARRLCYYLIHRFRIFGYMELYDTTDLEFRRSSDEKGNIFWEYDERRAMKFKNKEVFREIVRSFELDVVECLDKYYMHLPSKPIEDEPRRLFLTPISKPRSNVWFCHQNISAKTLRSWYRYMAPTSKGSTIPQNHTLNLNQPRNVKACAMDMDEMASEGPMEEELTKVTREHHHPEFGRGGGSDAEEANTDNDEEITDTELPEGADGSNQVDPSASDLEEITM
ncbi:uncharacterized protein LOC9653486 isoform X1 [Selaginella moellendorffii]|uniref:uncharacterized protein LOC9653486 isoform X1 n=1 Tax=Selaginella moellendorffii TaxID=88036 RepID=UPI000D1C829B|nr:uncharacterized protein LOC9653486 isoform X1 [Selaginella moellendorffii]|eukprot:XP_024515377.1 uncharacterized protein LOC9653486 isoform X1 [Selaginella moellendorffii]